MTLQRQLFITIIVLFTLMFVGTLTITTIINHDYINNQLRTHARDAATSLGLILSQESNQTDLATMSSIIDAVYERGYYQTITLTDVNNKTLVTRNSNITVAEVPAWFVDFVNFKMPTEDALVMSGWKNFGKVSVSSHPGYAYQDLWKNTYFTFLYYLVISILLLLAGVFAIHGLLRPLQAITKQAIAIGEGEFPLIERLPKTLQLRQVAITLNTMVKKLEQRFEEYRHVTTELRKRVYQDPVTDLNNQSYFNNQIQQDVSNSVVEQLALIIQIEISGLAQYNLVHGTAMGDELLKKFTVFLLQFAESIPLHTTSRLMGARFALLILQIEENKVAPLIHDLAAKCRDFAARASTVDAIVQIYLGAEIGRNGMSSVELLAASDIALTAAKTDQNHYNIQALRSGEIHADILWSDILQYILREKTASIQVEPCFSRDHGLLFQEMLYTATTQAGEQVNSQILQVMAERFNLDNELLKSVIDDAFEFIETNLQATPKFVIPLSSHILQSNTDIQWLEAKLRQQRFANRIIFEISEFHLLSFEQDVIDFAQRLLPLGVQFAFRNYGKSRSDLTYLKRLKIVYLKIDASYINQIQDHEDNQLFVEVLIRMAHCIDIAVIAEGVKTTADADLLLQLGIDGLYNQTSNN